MSFRKTWQQSNAVKEAFDNLPSGVCFFDSKGLVKLCNRKMYQILFLLTGRDLQMLGELENAVGFQRGETGEGRLCMIKDGRWWSFTLRIVRDGAGRQYTEAAAFDVTDLHEKQKLLQEANEAKNQTLEALERIQENILSIAREEEILAMKTELHSELGYHLQTIRRFYQQGCPPEEKQEFLENQKNFLGRLKGEIGKQDEIDDFAELVKLADTLGMQVEVAGSLPKEEKARKIAMEALRECITNTIRHASGDKVFLALEEKAGTCRMRLTNNGERPRQEIKERGGLLSLRKRVEGSGGIMTVRAAPEFELRIELPKEEEWR